MKKSTFCLFILAVFFLKNETSAQPFQRASRGHLHVVAKVSADSVVLRWAIADPAVWMLRNRTGYAVERFELFQNDAGGDTARYQILTPPGGFRPKDVAGFQKMVLADRSDNYLPVAAQCLFGKSFSTKHAPDVGDSPGDDLVLAQTDQQNRWTFANVCADFSPKAADALALRWADRQPPKGALLVYRVVSMGGDAGFLPDTVDVFVNTATPDSQPLPPVLHTEGLEKGVRLWWADDRAGLKFSDFTGFFIEKKGADGWQRLNKLPLLATEKKPSDTHEWLDSVSVNYQKAEYRIVACTPFGETTAPSAPVTGFGRDRTPPIAPTGVKAASTVESFIRIFWKKASFEPDLAGFRIEKSFQVDGPFEPAGPALLPKTVDFFIDKNPELLTASYYRVVAVDTAGNVAASYSCLAEVADSLAPGPPTGLHGSIGADGMARLAWKLGPEPDIFGYRVFFMNQSGHEPTNITAEPVQDTLFFWQTTLKSLTEKVYFRVVAVDRHFNHSAFSEMAAVARPDTIRPIAPGWKNWEFEPKSDAISLEWINSSSKDVAEHRLLRLAEGQKDWEVLQILKKKETGWRDANPPGGHVQYAIEAIDDAGNRSGWRQPASLFVKKTVKTEPVGGFSAIFDKKSKSILLNWDYPNVSSDDLFFILYKAKGNGSFEAIRSVGGEARSFSDRLPTGTIGTLRYAISAKKRGAAESERSVIRTVEAME